MYSLISYNAHSRDITITKYYMHRFPIVSLPEINFFLI